MTTRRRPPGPPPDAPRVVRDRAALFLEAQDRPVSSALLAREVLGLRQGSEDACAAILGAVLTGDPRLDRTPEGRWALREPGACAPAPEVLLDARAWAVWAVEAEARAAAVVRLEAGRVVEERAEPADDDEAPRAAAPMDDAAVSRLAALAGGALWTSWEPASLVPRGSGDDRSSVFVPLADLARACLGAPRPRTLERLASSLGLTFVDPETPLARARLAAECLLGLLDRDPLRGRGEAGLRALLEGSRTRPLSAAQPGSPLQRDLDAIPSEPGVYRFFDRDGRLVYVGKSGDLRRRVGSYFAARERPDPRTASWLGSVDRIEHERSGSDLEAVLREADQIARRAPSGNRQRTVRARRGALPGNLVLVQRAEAPGSVRVALVKDGRLAARVVLGPRGGGGERLRRLVGAIYFASDEARRKDAADPSRVVDAGPGRAVRRYGASPRLACCGLPRPWSSRGSDGRRR